VLRRLLISVIHVYQKGVSPWTPATCRFTPTCSAYAIEAMGTHGVALGGWLTVKRVARCHPWGGFGLDPVPPRLNRQTR